jgi:hypothetical protein
MGRIFSHKLSASANSLDPLKRRITKRTLHRILVKITANTHEVERELALDLRHCGQDKVSVSSASVVLIFH